MKDVIQRMVDRGIQNIGNLTSLKKVMRKAQQGENITLGFIGGSITMGSLSSSPKTCYAYLVYSWWCNRFPESKVRYVNAGIGGTTSHFGIARVESDLLYASPDWIITEFSVNDKDEEHFAQTYEGLLRKILLSKKDMAILVVNSVQYDDGVNAQECHNTIAKAYDLPIVSMKQSIYEEILAGTIRKEEITPDNLHPNDMGHQFMADIIIECLERVYAILDKEESLPEVLKDGIKEPITQNGYEHVVCYRNYNCTYNAQGFVEDNAMKKDISDIFKQGWYGKKKADRIIFHIASNNIAIQYRKSVKQPAPIAYAILDDDVENKIKLDSNFVENWGDCLYIENILCNGDHKEHKIEIVIEDVPPKCEVAFYLASIIA